MFKRRIGIVVIPLALVLSACGTNLGGEPKIVQENEIIPQPTAIPSPTQVAQVEATAVPDTSPTPGAAEATPTRHSQRRQHRPDHSGL